MTLCAGAKDWWSAQDLAEAALRGLPKTKRKINELALAEGWAFKTRANGQALARPRAGRGGGLEYHVSLLPPAASPTLWSRPWPTTRPGGRSCGPGTISSPTPPRPRRPSG